MRDDGGPDGADDDQSADGGHAHGPTDVGYWDETLLGGSGNGESDETADDGPADGDAADGGDPEDDESPGNVAGEFRPAGPVEPGSPDLENALFVIAGAYVAVLGLTRLFVDQSGFDAQDLLVLTAGTLLVGIVFLGFFGVLTPDT